MKLTRDDLQRLYRYGFSLTGNEPDAHDLLQRAIERTLSKGVEPEHPVRYLMRAMRHRFIDEARARKRAPHVDYDELAESGDAVDWSEQVLDNVVIASVDMGRIWEQLASEERELLYMWAVEEYTAAEIAAQTETPRNTILSRIHRLRHRLRRRFGAHTEEDAS